LLDISRELATSIVYLNTKAEIASETSVHASRISGIRTAGDSNLHSHHHENVKSYILKLIKT
jgi:predicted transcriptional regulator